MAGQQSPGSAHPYQPWHPTNLYQHKLQTYPNVQLQHVSTHSRTSARHSPSYWLTFNVSVIKQEHVVLGAPSPGRPLPASLSASSPRSSYSVCRSLPLRRAVKKNPVSIPPTGSDRFEESNGKRF